MSAVDWTAPFDALAEGQGFATRGRTVTEADVVGFAALTGDRHPLHTDAHWAAASGFGGRIAHGMLIVSYAVGLVPFDPDRVFALRRVTDVVFKQPARLGDTIRVEGTIEQLSVVNSELGSVKWRWSIGNQRQVVLCRARLEILWRRGGPGREIAAIAVQGPAASLDQPYAYDYPSGVFPC